jgi:hypothetical protein
MKIPCDKCNHHAVWIYGPGGRDEIYYCEDCVPSRGCECNAKGDDLTNLATDDFGRLLPCCEYQFYDDGIEDDL